MRHTSNHCSGLGSTRVLAAFLISCLSSIASGQTDAIDLYNRGCNKQDSGDLNGAIADYTRAIELDPNLFYAYNGRGWAKKAKADWDGAIADFSRAIELNPKYAEAYDNRGVAKQGKGDLDGAAADFARAIGLDPKGADAYGNRANAKYLKGDLDGAIADYSRVIELEPKTPLGSYYRGNARRAKGDLGGAIADYSRAIELDPKNADSYRNRGSVYLLQRRWDEALADLHRACELQATHQDYPRFEMWLIRMRLKESDEANKELADYMENRAKEKTPDWPAKVADFLLGKTNEANFLAAAASSDAETDSGQHCEAWFYAGMKHRLAGDDRSASECFTKCIATGRATFEEYEFAKAEMKAISDGK